jgi:long-subunit fatty acid transport protein
VQALTPGDNTYNYSNTDYNNFLNNAIVYQLYLANTFRDTVKKDEGLSPLITGMVDQKGIVREGGGINHWSFGGGMDVAKDLSLGITLNFVSGSYSYDREFTETDSRNVHTVLPEDLNYWTYTSNVKSDITGFNALFGLMYRKPGKYRVGATVRIPTTYDISETFTDDGFSKFDNGFTASTTSGGDTKYRVTTPMVLSGGISVQPFEWLLLAGDAEYTDWTQMEFNTDNPVLIQENRYIKEWMRDTWNLRGGAEVSIINLGLILRAGIESKPSPWKGDPSSYDQLTYTAGLGFVIDGTSTINTSFAYGTWKTFRDNYIWGVTPASRTSEAVTTQTISLTFSHRF